MAVLHEDQKAHNRKALNALNQAQALGLTDAQIAASPQTVAGLKAKILAVVVHSDRLEHLQRLAQAQQVAANLATITDALLGADSTVANVQSNYVTSDATLTGTQTGTVPGE